jgi:allantoinase
VTPEGVRAAAVHVDGGRIARVSAFDDVGDSRHVVEAGELYVLPGLVDTHVHVNEPGRTEWEGFATATRAAAAGGVTTIIDMPLNSVPPTTTLEGLEAKRQAAQGQAFVDVGFWGGAVPGNLDDLEALHRAGVFGFKCFLVPSGVEEFPHVGEKELRVAMTDLARLGALLLVHAEAPELIQEAGASDPGRYETYLRTRPPEAEVQAVEMVVEAARDTGCRAHVLHLSAADALEALPADGVTAETCPHYLDLRAEDIADGATEFKCAPPIRDTGNRERLWEGLRGGAIGLVVSDHSPSPAEMKGSDFLRAWGGIASLQLGLSVVWNEARRRGFAIEDVVRWMSGGPAGLARLPQKGAIEVGRDADLVLFHPEARWRVDPEALQHRHPVTPYARRWLDGKVKATYLRGVEIYRDGTFSGEPAGRLLERADP